MKVLHLCRDDFQSSAGKASLRLHQGLLQLGIDSEMLVEKRGSKADKIRLLECPMDLRSRIGRSLRRKNQAECVHGSYLSAQITACDVLHLHDVEGLWDKKSYGQLGFAPVLIKTLRESRELGKASWPEASQVYNSHWLREKAGWDFTKGPAETQVIHDGIDLQALHPHDRNSARDVFNIGREDLVLWIGPVSVSHLEDLAQKLSEAAAGRSLTLLSWHEEINRLEGRFRVIQAGRVDRGQLSSVLYSLADVLLLPAFSGQIPREFPEALASGIPILRAAEVPAEESADSLGAGVIVSDFSAAALGQFFAGLDWERSESFFCRRLAEKDWDGAQTALNYLDLYRKLQTEKLDLKAV